MSSATRTIDSLDDAKAELRAAAREARSTIHPVEAASAARRLRDRFLAAIDLAPGAIVAGYAAFGGEIDPLPLLEALHAKGHPLALPAVEKRAAPLVFRAWKPGDALERHRFGMAEPAADSPRCDPDMLLVPLLAFDGEGNRLGYGGGFYDRTIPTQRKRKPLRAVGVAFASQRVARVPAGIHDQRLDWVATDREVLRTKTDKRADRWMSWWPW